MGLAWVAMLGYLRLMTSRTVLLDPFTADEASGHVRSRLERPMGTVIGPGPRHLDLIEELLRSERAPGLVTTDVHLAALAIEHQAELCSNNTDLSRVPGLR